MLSLKTLFSGSRLRKSGKYGLIAQAQAKYASSSSRNTSAVKAIDVKAYYIARGIDILRVHASSYGSRPTSFQSKSLTITLDENRKQYISVFKYGSVVLFNVPSDEHSEHLNSIQEAANGVSIPPTLQHTEEYYIMEDNALDKQCKLKSHDRLAVKDIDGNCVQIVGGVMAQTVALDYYAVMVEKIVENFMRMNQSMGDSGKVFIFPLSHSPAGLKFNDVLSFGSKFIFRLTN